MTGNGIKRAMAGFSRAGHTVRHPKSEPHHEAVLPARIILA